MRVSRRGVVGGVLLSAAVAEPAGAAEAGFSVDAVNLLRIFQAAIEGHLKAMLRTLRAVATTAESKTPTWTSLGPALRAIVGDAPSHPSGWLAALDGSFYSTFANGRADGNLSAEPYFAELAAGKDIEAEVVLSPVSHQRSIIVATPVRAPGYAPTAYLGLDIPARAVMEVLDQYYTLPENLQFIVVNDEGLIILHSEHPRIFKSPDVADPSMAAALRTITTERSGVVRYRARGKGKVAVFNKSDQTGWRFVLAKTV